MWRWVLTGRGGPQARPARDGKRVGHRRLARAGLRPAPAGGEALRALAALAALLGLLAWPAGAAAHTGVPETRERVQAGPYALELRYYSEPRAGQGLALMIVPLEGARPGEVRVTATLGAGTDALAARVRTAPDPDDPAATDALIPLSTAGFWLIAVEASGPAGTGRAETAITAAAPGAIPVPVGWAIGLSPLIGIVGFAVAQRRWRRGLSIDD